MILKEIGIKYVLAVKYYCKGRMVNDPSHFCGKSFKQLIDEFDVRILKGNMQLKM